MKYWVIACLATLTFPAYAAAQDHGVSTDNFNKPFHTAIAQETRRFINKRQGCDHFRGEPPYDEERKNFLLARMKELCTGTDAELKRLRAKYKDQPETIQALADFDDCIEFDTICSADNGE